MILDELRGLALRNMRESQPGALENLANTAIHIGHIRAAAEPFLGRREVLLKPCHEIWAVRHIAVLAGILGSCCGVTSYGIAAPVPTRVIDARAASNPARMKEHVFAAAHAHRMAGAARLCTKYGFGAPLAEPDYDWDRQAYIVWCYPGNSAPPWRFGEILSETLP